MGFELLWRPRAGRRRDRPAREVRGLAGAADQRFRNIQRLVRPDFLGPLRAQLDADREARFRGEAPAMIPVVAPDPQAPSALPTPDSYQWFTDTGRERAKSWRNEVTLRTLEMLMEYEPGSYITKISPTPLMMVVAVGDTLAVAELAIAAFNEALEPKKFVLLEGGHFDAYVGDFEKAANPARDWFVTTCCAEGARLSAAVEELRFLVAVLRGLRACEFIRKAGELQSLLPRSS